MRKLIKILIFVMSAVCFVLLAFDITGRYLTAGFDLAAYQLIRTPECEFVTGLAKVFTNFVHPAVLLVISLSMIHFLKQNKYMIPLMGNLLLTVLLNLAIKGSFMRVRPPEELRLVAESGYSFPSGHTMVAFSFYGFIIFLAWQAPIKKRLRNALTVFNIIMPFLVGLSRIYLGVHYATDVVGGIFAAGIYLTIYTSVIKWYIKAIEQKPDGRRLFNVSINQRMLLSFMYAFRGIGDGIKNEPNMMIHYCAVVLVVVFGVTLRLSVREWCTCTILCGLVISLEQINTSIEAVVDLVTEEKKELARLAKDTAAGAVLVSAITAAIVGGMIFFPKMLALFT